MVQNEIKVNELRIGNLFQGERFSIARYGIFSDGIMAITGYGIYLLSENDNILDLKPIPLTEEWLLKFGFVQFKKNNYWFRIGFNTKILNVSVLGYMEIEDINGCCINIGQIDYIHQLQNLYFALTGEELTTK